MDPKEPRQFGQVLFPEWYPGFEYKKHMAMVESLGVLEEAFADWKLITGRDLASVRSWGCEDADTVLLGIGSMMRTALHTAQRLRERGQRVGVAELTSFRPFPEASVVEAIGGAKTVAVLDRDIGYGTSGMVYPDVLRSLYHSERRPRALNFVIGTGGKDITPERIERCLELAGQDHGTQTVFWPDARGPAEGVPYGDGGGPGAVGFGASNPSEGR
jgi:pyruvate ferredoxin oxidoreductase alpha subunit